MKALNLTSYEPNFNNKRVVDRVALVLAWCNMNLSSTSTNQIHNSKLTKVFGTQTNALSKYLRANLLQQSGLYTVGKISMSYTLNQEGFDKLSAKIHGSGNHIQNDRACAEDLYPELITLNFQYTDKSYRLWNPLQNMKSSKKQEFWAGYLPFNYDVDACAPTILLQLAQKHGLVPLLAGPIQSYLDNKDAFREHVAKIANIEVKVAKRLINSLFNGARLSCNYFCSAFSLVDFNKDAMRALQNDEQVTSLRSSIKRMWERIGTVANCKTSKDKWNVYFKLERKVLDAVKFFLDEKKMSYFTEHDGFRSAEEINTKELSDFVFSRTSIRVNFSAEDTEKKVEKKAEKKVVTTITPPANDCHFREKDVSISHLLNKRRGERALNQYQQAML